MLLAITLVSLLTGTTNTFVSLSPMVDDHMVKEPIIITISGPINENAADLFDKDINHAVKTGQPIIPIIVNSYGGNVHSVLQMMDAIDKVKNMKIKVATICIGKCMSAGAALLTCGSEGMRFAGPNATIMIHEVSSMTGGKIGDIKVDADESDRLNKILLETMSQNIGKDKGYLSGIIFSKGRSDWYLSPKDAIEHGVINHISVPDLKIKISVDVSLEL